LILNKWVILECGNFDKYGRILGKIKINKNDKLYINDDMINKGYGYFGGTKKS
jgi:endonuclease YncB( thermonuclease family)